MQDNLMDNLMVTLLLGRPTHELSFLSFFFVNRSSREVDDHEMYWGGSVVGKASTIGIEIYPPLP